MSITGPMFQPEDDGYRVSLYGRKGGHYNTYKAKDADKALELLRIMFSGGEANDLNFVLFSTSGVHGTYTSIEEAWRRCKEPDIDGDVRSYATVTFLLIQPRLVSMTFGEVAIRTDDDYNFLRRLRESSWRIVPSIGDPSGDE